MIPIKSQNKEGKIIRSHKNMRNPHIYFRFLAKGGGAGGPTSGSAIAIRELIIMKIIKIPPKLKSSLVENIQLSAEEGEMKREITIR